MKRTVIRRFFFCQTALASPERVEKVPTQTSKTCSMQTLTGQSLVEPHTISYNLSRSTVRKSEQLCQISIQATLAAAVGVAVWSTASCLVMEAGLGLKSHERRTYISMPGIVKRSIEVENAFTCVADIDFSPVMRLMEQILHHLKYPNSRDRNSLGPGGARIPPSEIVPKRDMY